MKRIFHLAGVLWATALFAQTPMEFQQDFDFAIMEIASTYAYFDIRATRWNDMPALYANDIRGVKTRDEFVALLEKVVDELHDPHAQLNTNLKDSFRLVPSGTDLWAQWRQGQATITQVRDKSDAQRAGLRPGDVVTEINGVPMGDALDARLGRSYPHSDAAARDWALRSVLAGRHDTPRVLQVHEGRDVRTVTLPAADQFRGEGALLETSEIRPGVGYISINDSLGNGGLVAEFDRALDGLRDTRGLVIDLRNTASGGNSSVARGILGRFVQKELPYQKHALPSEERDTGVRRSWLELVTPRGTITYTRPVAVLVNRWTGSMGEGLAIGFDATGSGKVIGTVMASLVGATTRITLPHSGIGINVPDERLYHVNGTPRELFQPPLLVDITGDGPGRDAVLDAALQFLAAK